MRGRSARSVLAASTALAVLLLIAPAISRSDQRLLARIDKLQPRAVPPALVAALDVVQELETCWLVRLPEDRGPDLAHNGMSGEILGSIADEDVLFLASAPAPEDLDALRQAGTVWRLDSWNALLRTDDEEVRTRIPARLHLKRLAERIDRPPLFRLTGRNPAAARTAPDVRLPAASPVLDMVAQVSTQSLAESIKHLEAFQTRYASLPSCAAAGAWLFDSFTGLGLQVERDEFPVSGFTATNVVATLPGRTSPDQIVLVTSHYDSYSDDRLRLAPGADDNGSGTAAVLELARILSRRSFDFTIKFVTFSAEELGLYGSRHFAQEARLLRARIIGVINLDMVGYVDQAPEDLDLIVNSPSEWLANLFTAATNAYAPVRTLKVVNASFNRSDHAPFWDQGYSALCGIEDWNPPNPNYHKTYDTFDTLNMDFEAAVTRASLATVAALAQPFATPQPPATVTVEPQTVGSVFLRATTAHVRWSAVPGAAGYNVYRAAVSRGPYIRVNTTPLTGTTFVDRLRRADAACFYVVTSVDASGNEGNYSAEVALPIPL